VDSEVTLHDLVTQFAVLQIGNTVATTFASGTNTTADVTVPNDSRGTPAHVCRIVRGPNDATAIRFKPYVGTAPANSNLTILNANRPVLVYTGGCTTIRFHRDTGTAGNVVLYVTPLDNL